MLRKLMKYELRATSRVMLPLFGIVLILSLGMSLLLRGDGIMLDNVVMRVLASLLSVAYGISLGAVFIVVLVLMINRFRTNLLGDEGYVMFTLPVSVHKILWSKIIISCLWFVCATLLVTVSAFIVAASGSVFGEMLDGIRDLCSMLNAYYAMHGTLYIIEALAVLFFSYSGGCLQFYAAMSFGQSFSRRKALWSIGFFIGVQMVMQFVFSLFAVSDFWDSWIMSLEMQLGGVAGVHAVLLGSLLLALVYNAIFYVVTTYFLKNRLNIE